MAGSEEPAAAPDATVVVPSLGRSGLDRLIRALANQTVPPATFEVVVVLNGPRAEWIPPPVAAGLSLRVIHHAEPGRAGAVNAGAASAGGELIVLLDDDMEPVPTWLAAHRDFCGRWYRRCWASSWGLSCLPVRPAVPFR